MAKLAAAAWLAFLTLPGIATAAGPPVTVTPDSLFAFDVPAGSSWTDTLTISNESVSTIGWQILGSTRHGEPPIGPLITPTHEFAGVSVLWDRAHREWGSSYQIARDVTARGGVVTANGSEPITTTLLEGYDILVVSDPTGTSQMLPWSNDEALAVALWVSGGGGLVLAGERDSSIVAFELLLSALGAEVELSLGAAGWGSTDALAPHRVNDGVSALAMTPLAHISGLGTRAYPMVLDASGVPVAAIARVGLGRLAILTDDMLGTVDGPLGDNLHFLHQLFRWAAGPAWLRADPVDAWTKSGESSRVAVTVETTGLDAGSYSGAVGVDFRDLVDEAVPLELRVLGTGDVRVSSEGLDFGSVSVGAAERRRLYVWNVGSDSLRVTGAGTAGSGFSVAGNVASLGPEESLSLEVLFTPASPGAFTGELVITSNDPDEPSRIVDLVGTGIGPPVWQHTATMRTLSLPHGSRREESFVISNAGASPLHWESFPLPEVANPGDGTRDMPGLVIGWADRYSTPRYWTVVVEDIVARGAELRNVTRDRVQAELPALRALRLGTSGSSASDAVAVANWVREGGGLLLEGREGWFGDILSELGSGISYIVESGSQSGVAEDVTPHAATYGVSAVHVSPNADHLRVEGSAVALIRAEAGRVVGAAESIGKGRVFVVSRDFTLDLSIGWVQNRLLAARALEWLAGPTWLGATPRRGTVAPGDSVEVALVFDLADAPDGPLGGLLRLVHDDPVAPESLVPMLIDVLPAPRIALPPALDRDSLAVNTQWLEPVVVRNTGTMTLQVGNVRSSHAALIVEPSSFALAPGDSVELDVRFWPDTAGDYEEALTFESNDPVAPEAQLFLRITVFVSPAIQAAPTDLSASVQQGQILADTVWVANDGGSDLDWSAELSGGVVAEPRLWTLPRSAAPVPADGSRAAGSVPNGGAPARTASLGTLTGVRILQDERHNGVVNLSALRNDLVARGASIVASSDSITAATLQGFDILWLCCYRPWVPAEAHAVGDWVRNGGSILVSGWDEPSMNFVLGAASLDMHVKTGSRSHGASAILPHSVTQGTERLAWSTAYDWCFGDDPSFRNLVIDDLGHPCAAAGEVGRSRIVVMTMPIFYDPPLNDADNRIFMNRVFDWLAGAWLSAEPRHGIVAPGERMPVVVARDSRHLEPGAHDATLTFSHDVPDVPAVPVIASLTVTLGRQLEVIPGHVDFGGVLEGYADSATVRLHNPGDIPVVVSALEVDGADFSVDAGAGFQVAPGASRNLVVRVLATGSGPRTGTLRIVHNAAGGPTDVSLSAVGAPAPVITVSPLHHVVTVPPDGQAESVLEVCNGVPGSTGGAPAAFGVALERVPRRIGPRSHSEVVDPEDRPERVVVRGAGGPDAFGYGWRDSDHADGPEFDWVDLNGVATVLDLGDNGISTPIDIGFPFPFYGEVFTQLRYTTDGWLTFVANGSTGGNEPLPSASAPAFLMAPFWDDLTNGALLVQATAERTVIQFDHVIRYGHGAGGPYTFEVILYPDGRFVFQYLRMNAPVDHATIGIQNGSGDDGLTVAHDSRYAHDGLAVEFWQAPPWVQAAPRHGGLGIGDCGDVTLSFDAAGLHGGDYDVDVVVTSEDPDDPRVVSRARMHVLGDPGIDVTPSSLDFGGIPVGRFAVRDVHVTNTGSGWLGVRRVESSHPDYAVGEPFELAPGGSADIPVTFRPASFGPKEGQLLLRCNDPAHAEILVNLSGEGRGPPRIDVAPATFAAQLFAQEVVPRTVTITNLGDANLEWRAGPAFGFHPPVPGKGPSGNALGGLMGWRVLWPRTHWQTASSWADTVVADLGTRGVRVEERTQPVTRELLAEFDAVWVVLARRWTDEEAAALAAWVHEGGALLLTGEYSTDCGTFNHLLEAAGSGVRFDYRRLAISGRSGYVYPHPATVGVDSLDLSPTAELVVTGDSAGPLFEDVGRSVIGAYCEVGLGRIVAIADGIFSDGEIRKADHRTLASRTFEWLAGPVWLSMDPASGVVPPGQSADVALSIDGANLAAGDYAGQMIVQSNDEASPVVAIDVAAAVRSPVSITPRSFLVDLAPGATAVDTLRVENLGSAPIVISVEVDLDAAEGKTAAPGENPPLPLRDLLGQRLLWPRGHGEAYWPTAIRGDLVARGLEWGETNEVLTPSLLADFDIVVLARPASELLPSEADALKQWLEAGGSLFCILGSERLNRPLDVIGAGIRLESATVPARWLVPGDPHPATAGVDSLREGTGGHLLFAEEPAQILLRDAEGQPAAAFESVGQGRLVVTPGDVVFSRYSSSDVSHDFGRRLFDWLAAPSWLEAEPAQTVIAGGETGRIAVHFGRGRSTGTRFGRLVIRQDWTAGAIDSVAVAATVGIPGYLGVTPSALDFGTVYGGGSATDSLTLTNTGSAELFVLEVSAEPSEFGVDLANLVLGPGESRIVHVTFSPGAVGSYPGLLTLTSTDPVHPVQQVPLLALALEPQANIELSNTALNFGSVFTTQTATAILTVTNSGTLDLNVSAVTVDLPFSPDATAFVVPAHESRPLTVTFAPTVPGTFARTLSISSDDPDQPEVHVALSGLGVLAYPEITVGATLLDFGTTLTGTVVVDTLTIGNIGDAVLVVSEFVVPPPFAAEVTTLEVPPGEERRVAFTFLPSAAGSYEDVALLRTNDPDESEVRIDLRAQAIYEAADIDFSTRVMDFGEVFVGTTATDTLRVLNLGAGGLIVSGVTAPEPYAVAPTELIVPPGEWRPLVVTMSPSTSGTFLGDMVIASNDSLEPSVEIGLVGLGALPPIVGLSPDSLFADVVPGGAYVDTVTVSNSGEATLRWTMAVEPQPGTGAAAGPRVPVLPARSSSRKPASDGTSAGKAYRDLSGVRILYDRSNGQSPSSGWSRMIEDLAARGAVVEENLYPVTFELLAPYDIVWTTEGIGWSVAEAAEVAAWYAVGKGLLLDGDQSTTAFNRILDACGIPASYVSESTTYGQSPNMFPHPTTLFVHALYDAAYAKVVPSPPTVLLHSDVADRPLAAAHAGARSRAVLLSGRFLSNSLINLADDRKFGNQVFDWLAAAVNVTAEPDSGSLAQGGAAPVALRVDAEAVSAGDYPVDLVVSSNDPVTPTARVPILIRVSGSPAVAVDPVAIDFGMVYTGHSVSERVDVVNVGTDTLHVVSITPDLPVYRLDGSIADLPPFTGLRLTLSFEPTIPGAYAANLVIVSDDPDEPVRNLPLAGTSLDPPVVQVAPAQVTLGLPPETVYVDSLTISNAGGSDLEWAIGQQEGGQPPPYSVGPFQVFWDRSHGEPGIVQWIPLTSYLEYRGVFVNQVPGPIDATSLAPYDVLWIANSTLPWTPEERDAVAVWVAAGGCLILEGDTVFALEQANLLLEAVEAGLAYTAEPGLPGVVTNRQPRAVLEGVPAITLESSVGFLSTIEGPAKVLFDDAGGRPVAALSRFGLGHVYACLADLSLAYNRVSSVFGLRIFQWFDTWISLDPSRGVLPAGESVAVETLFRTTRREPGELARELVIGSNDPITPQLVVPAWLHVTGTPVLQVTPGSLAFPVPLVGWSTALPLLFSNPGTDTLHIASGLIDHPDYGFVADTVIPPGDSTSATVVLTASVPGDASASLTITHDAPDSPTVIPLQAFALVEPQIQVAPDTLEVTLGPGEQAVHSVSICNVPGTPDSALASPLAWGIRIVDPLVPGPRGSGGPDAFGYTWIDSDEEGGPTFDWVDVRAIGTPMNLQGFGWNRGPFPIGFDFPYYGDTVTEFRACGRGWISFTSAQNAFANLPLPCACTNSPPSLVAPWWDEVIVPSSSPCWYHSDGTRVVIQFADLFRQGPTGGPYDFEVLLYADGRIVFQYLQMGGATNTATIGIQNEARDDGLTVAHNEAYVHDGLAVEIRPWPLWVSLPQAHGVVAPGECMDVGIAFDARRAAPGDFLRDLLFTSTDPDEGQIRTQVLLHVTGAGAATSGPEAGMLPVVFALHPAMPNPFGGVTRIRFDLPRESPSRIVVYDVSGRRVRTLLSEALPAGRHVVIWDGRDSRGSVAAAGVYFYRMEAADYTATRKVIRLR